MVQADYLAKLVAYERWLHQRCELLLESDYEAAAMDQRRATASIQFALANLREELDGFRQHERWIEQGQQRTRAEAFEAHQAREQQRLRHWTKVEAAAAA